MIRFVVGPDSRVVPDLAGRLPGRGLWVAADRASVETAAKKGLFSRSARTALKASPDLAAQVEVLLLRRLLDGLGLARRAGDLVTGFEKVVSTVSEGRAAWLVEFALIGLVAGLLAALAGSLASWAVVTQVMRGDWVLLPGTLAVTVLGCAALTLACAGALNARLVRTLLPPALASSSVSPVAVPV
jgi:predicted RNA-binding protein YlxR (DUF448 family)